MNYIDFPKREAGLILAAVVALSILIGCVGPTIAPVACGDPPIPIPKKIENAYWSAFGEATETEYEAGKEVMLEYKSLIRQIRACIGEE